MAAQWYCLIDDQEYGPYSSEELRIMAQNGQLQSSHSVRRDRQSPWTPATQVKGLFPAEQPADPPSPPSAAPAKPPVAVPATAEPPTAAPVASAKPPVAQPVAAPAAIPVGKAVATPVATPAIATPPKPPTPAVHGTDEHPHFRPRQRSNRAMYVIAISGGLLLALACLAIFAVLRSGPAVGGNGQATASNERGLPNQAPSGDPETDPESDPLTETTGADMGTSPADGHPALLAKTTWLDASSQKGGLRGLARFHVAEVRLEEAASGEKILKVEIHIRNDDRDKAMEFRTWNASTDHTDALAAFLFDPSDHCLEPAPSAMVSGLRAVATRVNPGETVTQNLVYLAPAGNTQDYRLLLPYAAIGRRSQIGFEIPAIMINTMAEGESIVTASDKPSGGQPPSNEQISPEDVDPAVISADDETDENPFKMNALLRGIEATAGEQGEDETNIVPLEEDQSEN